MFLSIGIKTITYFLLGSVLESAGNFRETSDEEQAKQKNGMYVHFLRYS